MAMVIMIMTKPWWWKSSVLRFFVANHTSIVWSKKKKLRVFVALLTVIGMPFLSWPVCLLARPCDMDMTTGEGHVCGEEGERVWHRGFGSTFVVDPRAKHGIACHSRDSYVFSSSLALEMDPDDSFIFSWVLWSLGCKSTADLSSSFSVFRKKTFKSCQGRRVSWPCFE